MPNEKYARFPESWPKSSLGTSLITTSGVGSGVGIGILAMASLTLPSTMASISGVAVGGPTIRER